MIRWKNGVSLRYSISDVVPNTVFFIVIAPAFYKPHFIGEKFICHNLMLDVQYLYKPVTECMNISYIIGAPNLKNVARLGAI